MITAIGDPLKGISFVDPAQDSALRDVLLHAHDNFLVYRDLFGKCGVNRQELETGPLHAAFSKLDHTDKRAYARLQYESLDAQKRTKFVVDASSGTTGVPILKFTSAFDDAAEAAAVRIAFETVGVRAGERCACLDIGASQIYLFYMRVLRELGLRDSMFFKVTSDYERTVDLLRLYDPDVILSIPSVLTACLSALKAAFGGGPSKPRKILYIGEPMGETLKNDLRSTLNAECFSFYGTTEIGSVGIECSSHRGMHIPLELFVPTIFPWPDAASECLVAPSRYRGTVAWTSLGIRAQPVVKYAVNDLVDLDLSECDCGCPPPRLVFHRRVDETFFLYGITFTYDFFLGVLEAALDQPVQLEIRLERSSGATPGITNVLVLTLDDSLRKFEEFIREELASVHPVSELLWSGFLRVQVEFVAFAQLGRRKGRRVTVIDGC